MSVACRLMTALLLVAACSGGGGGGGGGGGPDAGEGSACAAVCARVGALGCGSETSCLESCDEAQVAPVRDCVVAAASCAEAAACGGACLCNVDATCSASCACDTDCASLGDCGEVTQWGECQDNTLRRCRGGELWAQPCGDGTCRVEYPRTDPVDDSGCYAPRADDCTRRCDGEVLVTCVGEEERRLDCRLDIGPGAACDAQSKTCVFNGPSICIDDGPAQRQPQCLDARLLTVCDGLFRPLVIDCAVAGEGAACITSAAEPCCSLDGTTCLALDDGLGAT